VTKSGKLRRLATLSTLVAAACVSATWGAFLEACQPRPAPGDDGGASGPRPAPSSTVTDKPEPTPIEAGTPAQVADAAAQAPSASGTTAAPSATPGAVDAGAPPKRRPPAPQPTSRKWRHLEAE